MRPHYSVIMFDVDSKDPTLGMSCPPPAFVDQPFLQKVKSILTPEGRKTKVGEGGGVGPLNLFFFSSEKCSCQKCVAQ